jgi:hypothetical protein
MIIKPSEKKEFRLILKENYNMELSEDEASLINKNLVKFIQVLYKIYTKNHDEMHHIFKLEKPEKGKLVNKKSLDRHLKNK